MPPAAGGSGTQGNVRQQRRLSIYTRTQSAPKIIMKIGLMYMKLKIENDKIQGYVLYRTCINYPNYFRCKQFSFIKY